jgi:hypothetical protein
VIFNDHRFPWFYRNFTFQKYHFLCINCNHPHQSFLFLPSFSSLLEKMKGKGKKPFVRSLDFFSAFHSMTAQLLTAASSKIKAG